MLNNHNDNNNNNNNNSNNVLLTHSPTGAIPPEGGTGGPAHNRSWVPLSRARAHRAVVCTQNMFDRVYWIFIKGGCSRRGVQWMGVVLCNKTACAIMSTTTPCFHCTPLWWILSFTYPIQVWGVDTFLLTKKEIRWIRRLRKSLRYLLAIWQRKMTVSANPRFSAKLPQELRGKMSESWLAKLPDHIYRILPPPLTKKGGGGYCWLICRCLELLDGELFV